MSPEPFARLRGRYDISCERGWERRGLGPSLKTSKREPLAKARLERADVAPFAAKADVAVGAQQQQPIVAARAIACRERGTRRRRAQLEHGGEAPHERRDARLQRGLPLLARRQREQRARRVT